MAFKISTASKNEQFYDDIRAVTNPEAINQVWKLAIVTIDGEKGIKKCAEFAGLKPNPYKLYMIKNFLPYAHLVCRFNGDYSESTFKVTFEHDAIDIFIDDVLVFQVIEMTRREVSYKGFSHVGYATIDNRNFVAFTKLPEFDNIKVRSINYSAIEITTLASENFSLKAFIILDDDDTLDSDSDSDSETEEFSQNSPIEDDMVNQLQRFCTEMPDLCNCPNPWEIQYQDSLDNRLKGLRRTTVSNPSNITHEWKLLGTVDGLVNQLGAIYLRDSGILHSVIVSQKPNDAMKTTVFHNDRRVEIFSYRTKCSNIDQENKFEDCQIERISVNQIHITYHTSGFSFVTQIITSYNLELNCEVLEPLFKGSVAIVSLKNILGQNDEFVIASSLSMSRVHRLIHTHKLPRK